jgi:hypothetical protein
LEDIDAAFPSREQREQESLGLGAGYNSNNSSSDVTFSGLLNVLDGVSSRYEINRMMQQENTPF